MASKHGLRLTLFIVKQKGSEMYLPSLGRQGRGFSHYGLMFKGGSYGPRLFLSRRAALSAIGQWRRGKVTVFRSKPRLEDDDYGEDVRVVPVPGRADVQLEILEMVARLR